MKEGVDGFAKYAEFIIKNKLSEENPYFPRIYVMKNYIGSGERTVQKYKMEKLIGYDDIRSEELVSVYNKMFDDFDIELGDRPSRLDIHDLICDKITDAANIKKIDNFIDNNLIDACGWLQLFIEESEKQVSDLGGNNLLYRRTSIGLQPVISDPFF